MLQGTKHVGHEEGATTGAFHSTDKDTERLTADSGWTEGVPSLVPPSSGHLPSPRRPLGDENTELPPPRPKCVTLDCPQAAAAALAPRLQEPKGLDPTQKADTGVAL